MRKNPPPGTPVTVFIADSSALECQLMVRALQQSGKPIKAVGCAMESAEIPKQLGRSSPNVATISADLRDGRSAGLHILRYVRDCYPNVRIVVLVESPERAVVVEAFRAGADGVFSRLEPFEMLCKCIYAVCGGQVWASSEEMRFVIEAIQSGARPIKNANGTRLLTKREEELVQLVAEGLTNRDISRHLSLREHTVRNYLFRVFNQLGTSNRLELALYVLKQKRENQSAALCGGLFAQPTPTLSSMRANTKQEVPQRANDS